jgi:hypothetical protein
LQRLRENRLVTLDDFQITRVTFPTVPEKAGEYMEVLRKDALHCTRIIALDRIEANLAVTDAVAKTRTVVVKNDPPQIVFSATPAILVLIDGTPILRQVEASRFLRIINTRTLILFDQAIGKYFLRLMDRWMEAPKIDGPWSVAKNPSADLDVALQFFTTDPKVDLLDNLAADIKDALENGTVPTIYVRTGPAELVETDGEPQLEPIGGTNLLWVKNSINPILVDTTDQKSYVLLSGRWFRSRSLKEGPWEFVAADRLPPDFARIPESHPRSDVLASVAGTAQGCPGP